MSVSSDPRGDRAVVLPNGLLDDVGVAEVEEQRDQVGKTLVERGHVDVGRIEKRRAQAIEQRMRCLVSDDVVAERRADETALQREPRRLLVRAEVAEREVAGFAAVAGVGAAEAERPHDEPQWTAIGRRRRRPRDVPPEGAPECRVGKAADGVHHLQVEAAVGRRGRQAAREEQVRIVEVERFCARTGAPRARPGCSRRRATRSGQARASRMARAPSPRRPCGRTPTDPACRSGAAGRAARASRAGRAAPPA